MEPEDEKKKLNDDVVVFMRKRSETEAPRYTAHLRNYVDLQQKRRRAAAARKRCEQTEAKKKAENDSKDKPIDNCDRQGGDEERTSRRNGGACEKVHRHRIGSCSGSGSRSREPVDRCGCRQRRRKRSRRVSF